jgi:hypothetical protein
VKKANDKESEYDGLIASPEEGINSLQDIVMNSKKLYGDCKCFGRPVTKTV